ncbi:MAG: peptidylprolyl isomerase [Acidimicrobiales bacterium]
MKLIPARALSLLAVLALVAGACGVSRDGGEAAVETTVETTLEAPIEVPTGGGIELIEREAGVPAATITFADGSVVEIDGDTFDTIVAEVSGSERFINNIYQGNFGGDDERYMLGQMIMDKVFAYALAETGATVPEGLAAEQRTLLESDLVQAMVTEPDPEAASAEVLVEISSYTDMLTSLIASQVTLDDYLAGTTEGTEQTSYCARHILVDTEEEALDLMRQMEDGADFAELAAANSTDPGSGANGGDLGCSPSAAYVEPFALALEGATLDEVVGPVQSEYGFHIITVYDVKQETVAPDTSTAMEALITGTITEATIEVDPALGVWDSTAYAVIAN